MKNDSTMAFFDGLAGRHEPLLATTTGTIGLDLAKSAKQREQWVLSIDKGDVDVSQKGGATDCTVRAPAELFERIASGEQNAFAAALRGDVIIEGDSKLLVRLQRLFPSPPRSSQESDDASRGRRR